MYKSISYAVIRCTYNDITLKKLSGALFCKDASRIIMFRGRNYKLHYVESEDEFRLFNSKGLLVASIVGGEFQFFVSSAPEIGLEHVFSLLARLSVYPLNR